MSNLLIEIIFWIGFSFFNFLLFSVSYILNFKKTDFFPLMTKGISGGRGYFESENQDFFRFCLDVSILFFLCRLTHSQTLIYFTSIYYLLILTFHIYHYSFNYLYQTSPVLINDFKLIRQGVMYVWAESKLKVIFYALVISALTVFFFKVITAFLLFSVSISNSYLTFAGMVIFLILSAIALLRKGYFVAFDTWYRFLFFPLRVRTHIVRSIGLVKKSQRLSEVGLESLKYGSLQKKPNVHVLLIESYGSILLNDPVLSPTYLKLLKDFISGLSIEGYSTISNTSESVSLIGPSWLAYSTILLGEKLESNYGYEKIMYGNKHHHFPSIQKELQNQGYTSYHIDAGQVKSGIHVPFKEMESLFGIDKWLLQKDIPYTGTKYGFTESPPDQYVLNYSFEEYLQKISQPYVCFYLTKNSHTPFVSPEYTTKNWRSLNETPSVLIGDAFLQSPDKNDYLKAIKYQLQMIQDLIINQSNDDDIFLLMGDHQPHVLAGIEEHGVETITHVISKDEKLVKSFEESGFRDDVFKSKKIKHEDIRHILISKIFEVYGKK